MSLSLGRFGAPHTTEETFMVEGTGPAVARRAGGEAAQGVQGEEKVQTESAVKVAEG